MSELAAVRVAEAALRLHDSPVDWLVGVAECFGAAFEATRGTIAQEYETTPDGNSVRLLTDVQRGGLSEPLSQVGLASLSGAQCNLVYGQDAQYVTASQVFEGALPEKLSAHWGAMGVREVVGIFLRDPDGRGLAVAAALAESVRVSSRARARWVQVGHQMRLSARLHRKLMQTSLQALPHARFTSGGECVDARGEASGRAVRSHLRRLVEALREAREEAARGEVDSAFTLWERLSRGEWMLLDQFDGEHERHIVAAPCLASSPLRALSVQQEAIARAAGRGLSNKDIAAELGLSERSVDNQLRRALQKLGIEHRTALVRLWSALERAGQA